MKLKAHSDFHGKTMKSREVAGFTLRETVHEPGKKIAQHSHENAHLAFVLRGTFIEKCEQKTLTCGPMSVSFLAPGISHSDDIPDGGHSFLVEIAPSRLAQVQALFPLDEPIFRTGGVAGWLALKLYHESRQSDLASSLAAEGLALEMLAEVARQQALVNTRKPIGVHPVHLAAVFRQYYQCTIGEYLRQLRVEYACRSLSTSNDPLADIALAAGFSDQSHFSKVFKRLTGLTPAQYRATLRAP